MGNRDKLDIHGNYNPNNAIMSFIFVALLSLHVYEIDGIGIGPHWAASTIGVVYIV